MKICCANFGWSATTKGYLAQRHNLAGSEKELKKVKTALDNSIDETLNQIKV